MPMALLSLSLEDPRPWKNAVDALHAFLSDAVFYFQEDGVHLRAIDPSQVVLVEMHAPESMFSSYEVKTPPIRVPLNLGDYSRILARAGAEDVLSMELDDVVLKTVLERQDGTLRREFVLSLVDVPDNDTEISRPADVAHVTLAAKVMKEALRDASLFSSSVLLVARNDALLIEARAQSNFTRTIVRPGPNLNVSTTAEAASRYSLPILQNIVRYAESDEFLDLKFGTDTPLEVNYKLGPIRMRFYLAHMIL